MKNTVKMNFIMVRRNARSKNNSLNKELYRKFYFVLILKFIAIFSHHFFISKEFCFLDRINQIIINNVLLNFLQLTNLNIKNTFIIMFI